ncbi:hypothetical protein AOQ84DRAFT_390164 [Glonium stellatum]|uniref:DUF7492 domain-containing protein n=1 Tax=Glonium stellatum TaxID=574774 RepID=A0A8E2EX07_9PEZI|nr:hypothetical protein AOQ84DRAFT_390164 [Glonium stellatum]
MKQLTPSLILYLAFQAIIVSGHSWVDNVQRTDPQGQLVGEIGYIRNYTARVANQDVDEQNTHQLLNKSPEQIFCSAFQVSQFQANGLPGLKVSPGSQIVAQYLENGHISAPLSPASVVGDIYWFGTEDVSATGEDATTFGEVQSWKGGAGRGRLLGVNSFDDGKCGRGDLGLPCRSTFQIPTKAVVGSVYTVYWLWNYSGKLGNNTKHIEYYTSCMDVDIIG